MLYKMNCMLSISVVKYSINSYCIYYKTLILIYIYLTHIFFPEINTQSRCGNINHNS